MPRHNGFPFWTPHQIRAIRESFHAMIGKISPWMRSQLDGLSGLKDAPHAVALGIACGIFFGFIPLPGFKTLLAIATARLLRGNMVAAAVAVTLHDVILPLAPVILHREYQAGYWLMSHPHHLPPELHLIHHSPAMWLHWSTLFTVGLPLVSGSVLVAIPFAVIAYFVSLRLLVRSAARRGAAEAP